MEPYQRQDSLTSSPRRHPRLTAAGLVLGGTFLALRRGARNMADNDARQKSRPETSRYVPVDRSGGGL
ncbi:hypothetical protein N658DRAFT_494190 [Parathielavia hyrcaniae]|uniref:Uncharacterized protein n=1 Tax=Parathielavia hyrcaniae TaxID=113614 RepID=A0AAN6QA42_9PEZI|nr:hypothetical protein N658DRAFT_494190 [Parathielavia hyrcaniae]